MSQKKFVALFAVFSTSVSCMLKAEHVSSQQHTCPGKIYQFIEGIDTNKKLMSEQQKVTELNDVFARTVLCKSESANTLAEIIPHLDSPSLQLTKKQYVVAEGGQIPASATIPASANLRNMRYTISWTDGNSTAQVFASSAPVSTSTRPFLQLIAYDSVKKQFNFYERFETADNTFAFFWGGDSRWARIKDTIGEGCFDCHHNGVPIMKELKIPWNNWSSERANIAGLVVTENTRDDPPFKDHIGAQELEPTIKGTSTIYFPNFIRSHINADFTRVTNVPELLRFIMENTTVNLESNNPEPGNPSTFAVPLDFWLSDARLRSFNIGLDYNFPSNIMFSSANYEAYLKTTKSKLVQCPLDTTDKTKCGGRIIFHVPGATHFRVFTPVVAHEDVLMTNLLLRLNIEGRVLKLLNAKFITSVLMVDFQNPVFSEKRSRLMQYAKQVGQATINSNGSSNMPELVADAILAAAEKQPKCNDTTLDSCTAEQQFADTWNASSWRSAAESRVNNYLNGVSQLMKSADNQDKYLDLLVSRHRQMAVTPIIENLVEFSLLFPFSNQPATLLRMTSTGEVVPE